jgi:hypothetical protein
MACTLKAVLSAASLAFAAHAMAAPAPVAEYLFGNSFASNVAGAPSLVAVDPLLTSHFATDTVLGNSRTVYQFNGTTANDQQAGLTLSTAGLISNNAIYSVEIVFKFTEHENAWRRIVDVQNRQSDNGFYVDPSNNLDIYPVAGGSAFTNNVYHDVILSNSADGAAFYLDGGAQATALTSVMNIDANNRINFFLDNIVAGGQGEYSSGSVALIRLYDVALAPVDVPTTPTIPVPEPETYLLYAAGLALVGTVVRRRLRRD